jgi:ABC-2 type transport system ATP-binding protein
MKCELVAGLLHRPRVMFLDEPTLGLDVSMQGRLRRFLADYNRRSGVTVTLTSHYMADVAAMCPHVILIHHGRLLYDGALSGLAQRLTLRAARSEAPALTARLLDTLPVADLSVEDPPIEAVIDQIYQGGEV